MLPNRVVPRGKHSKAETRPRIGIAALLAVRFNSSECTEFQDCRGAGFADNSCKGGPIGMRVKRILRITGGVLLLVVILVGAVIGKLFLGGGTPEGARPPAENASEAPKADALATPSKTDTASIPPRQDSPKFVMPLTIQIETPQVPERLQEPTPLAKKTSTQK